jgi:hypothetical protein
LNRFAALALIAGLVASVLCADALFPKGDIVRRVQAQQATSFSFAAAGDHGANSQANASLAALDQSGVSFYLALGDIDYDEVNPDSAWCTYVQSRLPTLGGATFPFQMLAGNHEEQGGPDGYIMNHAACLPDRLSSTGMYAAQYYFDYPSNAPLMRVILISPDLVVENVNYQYTVGSGHYNWLESAIDGARSAGIPWVAVGMHEVCITAGNKECTIGTDLLNLLLEKRVDLVLQAHDHNYQRSKQLAHSPDCEAIAAGAYNASCVVDDGLGGTFAKGAGPIFVINGMFGKCCVSVNPSDAEAGYFPVMSSESAGFTQYTVEHDQLQAQFVATSGSHTDSFMISGDGSDIDGDGFDSNAELYLGTNPIDPCGEANGLGSSTSWPADLTSGGVPDTTNKVTINDLTSYLGPVRRINTSEQDADYDVRWDLVPGASVFGAVINIQDLISLILVAPPMLGGQRAFDGPACAG